MDDLWQLIADQVSDALQTVRGRDQRVGRDTRICSIYAIVISNGVPLLDRVIELQARVSALPCGEADLLQERVVSAARLRSSCFAFVRREQRRYALSMSTEILYCSA